MSTREHGSIAEQLNSLGATSGETLGDEDVSNSAPETKAPEQKAATADDGGSPSPEQEETPMADGKRKRFSFKRRGTQPPAEAAEQHAIREEARANAIKEFERERVVDAAYECVANATKDLLAGQLEDGTDADGKFLHGRRLLAERYRSGRKLSAAANQVRAQHLGAHNDELQMVFDVEFDLGDVTEYLAEDIEIPQDFEFTEEEVATLRRIAHYTCILWQFDQLDRGSVTEWDILDIISRGNSAFGLPSSVQLGVHRRLEREPSGAWPRVPGEQFLKLGDERFVRCPEYEIAEQAVLTALGRRANWVANSEALRAWKQAERNKERLREEREKELTVGVTPGKTVRDLLAGEEVVLVGKDPGEQTKGYEYKPCRLRIHSDGSAVRIEFAVGAGYKDVRRFIENAVSVAVSALSEEPGKVGLKRQEMGLYLTLRRVLEREEEILAKLDNRLAPACEFAARYTEEHGVPLVSQGAFFEDGAAGVAVCHLPGPYYDKRYPKEGDKKFADDLVLVVERRRSERDDEVLEVAIHWLAKNFLPLLEKEKYKEIGFVLGTPYPEIDPNHPGPFEGVWAPGRFFLQKLQKHHDALNAADADASESEEDNEAEA